MRAGPLSNARVVALLNRYFVPVYAINEDYRKEGSVSAAERAEYQHIYREALKARLSTGTVHVYLVAPDGHPVDSLHVATAARVERLTDLLERTIKKLKTAEGKPLVKPSAQSVPPKKDADSLLLHLTARYLSRQGAEATPLRDSAHLGQTRHAGWWALPSENWIVLSRTQWTKLLPPGAVRAGSSWELDPETSARLLRYFYPQTENNDVATNRLTRQTLRATVLSIKDGVARARLDGRLTMKHSFYHRDDANVVEASVVGVLDFEPGKKQIRSVRLVTEKATYGRTNFGVAVRSLP